MKMICFHVDKAYQGDILFDAASPMNRDDCLSPFIKLKETLAKSGYECHTQEYLSGSEGAPAAIAFVEMPAESAVSGLKAAYPGALFLLFVFECSVIKPYNWDERMFRYFDLVFTWNEEYVDGKKFNKINFSNRLPAEIPDDGPRRRRMCVMVSANKSRKHPLELYSERKAVVEWFQAFHPDKFDLYGMGWDRPSYSSRYLSRFFALLPAAVASLFTRKYRVYRGPIDRKLPVLSKYKFAFCYENAKEIRGYITEKIFDAFFAGCVPVYYGAPDVARHIPRDCFVDRRDFASTAEVFSFLEGLSAQQHAGYVERIRTFLKSPAAREFCDEHFAESAASVIIRRLSNAST